MLPLFLLAFLHTEMQWRECEQDQDRVCSYPSYLGYETWQGLDLHWLAFIPGAIADAMPDSITPFPDRGRRGPALRYLIAFGSVAALWWVVGIWWERLHSGRLLPKQKEIAPRATAADRTIHTLVRPDDLQRHEGWIPWPLLTDAASVLPAMLLSMALVECGIFPGALRGRAAWLAISALLISLSAWAALADTERNQDELFLMSPPCSPTVCDAMMLQAPALLVALLVGLVTGSKAVTFIAVGSCWLTIVSIAQGRWPARTRVYLAIRPPLRAIYILVFGMTLIGWLIRGSQHGPTGSLGAVAGSGALVWVLRPEDPRAHAPA
jgi:hypothetical protein